MWVFDGKYYIVLPGCWRSGHFSSSAWCGSAACATSWAASLSSVRLIAAATVCVLPGHGAAARVLALARVYRRAMSLGVAVCVCALSARSRARMVERYALVVVAIVFFGFVYRDERALNALEDRMQDVVSSLPPGVRVVNSIQDPWLRTNPVVHMLDRVCIGRCYSYAITSRRPAVPHPRHRAEPDSRSDLQAILELAIGGVSGARRGSAALCGGGRSGRARAASEV